MADKTSCSNRPNRSGADVVNGSGNNKEFAAVHSQEIGAGTGLVSSLRKKFDRTSQKYGLESEATHRSSGSIRFSGNFGEKKIYDDDAEVGVAGTRLFDKDRFGPRRVDRNRRRNRESLRKRRKKRALSEKGLHAVPEEQEAPSVSHDRNNQDFRTPKQTDGDPRNPPRSFSRLPLVNAEKTASQAALAVIGTGSRIDAFGTSKAKLHERHYTTSTGKGSVGWMNKSSFETNRRFYPTNVSAFPHQAELWDQSNIPKTDNVHPEVAERMANSVSLELIVNDLATALPGCNDLQTLNSGPWTYHCNPQNLHPHDEQNATLLTPAQDRYLYPAFTGPTSDCSRSIGPLDDSALSVHSTFHDELSSFDSHSVDTFWLPENEVEDAGSSELRRRKVSKSIEQHETETINCYWQAVMIAESERERRLCEQQDYLLAETLETARNLEWALKVSDEENPRLLSGTWRSEVPADTDDSRELNIDSSKIESQLARDSSSTNANPQESIEPSDENSFQFRRIDKESTSDIDQTLKRNRSEKPSFEGPPFQNSCCSSSGEQTLSVSNQSESAFESQGPDYQPDLGDLKVICPYSVVGCQVCCHRDEIDSHLTVCQYRANSRDAIGNSQASEPLYNPLEHVVECPYAPMGCTNRCTRSMLPEHLIRCEFQSSENSQNGLDIESDIATDLETSFDDLCSRISCPHSMYGCPQIFSRGELLLHLDSCRFAPKSFQEDEEARIKDRQSVIAAEEDERARRLALLQDDDKGALSEWRRRRASHYEKILHSLIEARLIERYESVGNADRRLEEDTDDSRAESTAEKQHDTAREKVDGGAGYVARTSKEKRKPIITGSNDSIVARARLVFTKERQESVQATGTSCKQETINPSLQFAQQRHNNVSTDQAGRNRGVSLLEAYRKRQSLINARNAEWIVKAAEIEALRSQAHKSVQRRVLMSRAGVHGPFSAINKYQGVVSEMIKKIEKRTMKTDMQGQASVINSPHSRREMDRLIYGQAQVLRAIRGRQPEPMPRVRRSRSAPARIRRLKTSGEFSERSEEGHFSYSKRKLFDLKQHTNAARSIPERQNSYPTHLTNFGEYPHPAHRCSVGCIGDQYWYDDIFSTKMVSSRCSSSYFTTDDFSWRSPKSSSDSIDSSLSSMWHGMSALFDTNRQIIGEGKSPSTSHMFDQTRKLHRIIHDDCVRLATECHSAMHQYTKVIDVIRLRISKIASMCFGDLVSKVELFGSFSTGLAVPEISDVDLVIVLKKHCDDGAKMCWVLGRFLSESKWVKEVKVLDRAKMPVIKIVANEFSLHIDVTFSTPDHGGVATAAFVSTLVARHEDTLRPLMVVLKRLLARNGFSHPFTGGLGSYALFLMVLASLDKSVEKHNWRSKHGLSGSSQVTPPPITFDELVEDDTRLGTLLLDFLQLYGRDFDPQKHAVLIGPPQAKTQKLYKRDSLAIPGTNCRLHVGKRIHASSEAAGKTSMAALVVDDPIQPDNNAGGACFRFVNVQQVFAKMFARLISYTIRTNSLTKNETKARILG